MLKRRAGAARLLLFSLCCKTQHKGSRSIQKLPGKPCTVVSCLMFCFFFVFSKMRVIRRLPKHQNSCSRTRRRMWEIFASIPAHAPLSHSREPELDCKLPLYFCLNYNLLFLYRYWSCTGICVLCSTSQYCVWLTWKNKTEGQWFKLCRSRSDEFITEHRCFVHGFVLFFFFCPILIFLIVLKSRFHHM